MAAKKNITRSHEFSDSIIDTIREPLIALDHDLRVVNASRSFYKFFKVKPEETVGQLIYDLGNKQWDIPKLRELLETILPEKTTFDDYEVEHDFAAIGKRIMLLNARQIQRESGKERIILLAIEDITERKQLEELLEASEERFRRLFETASDGIVLLEKREGKIIDANPATEKLLGYTEKDSIGNKLQDIGVVLDMSDFQTTMQNLNKIGILNYRNVKVETKSGQNIDTEIYLVDRAKLVQCNIRDVTERKQAQEQLRQGQRELQALMDVSPIGIYWADLQGNIQYNNQKFRDLFGYTVEDIPTIAAWRLMAYPDPAYREQIPSTVSLHNEAQKQGKEADPLEVSITCKDGSIRHVLQAWAFTSNRILVTYADITERKQAEDALRKTEETYHLVVDNISEGITVLDLNLRFTYVSPSIFHLRGYTAEEVMAQTFEQIMTPESLHLVSMVFEEEIKLEASGTADPGRVRILELEEYRKDGSTVWLENHLSSFRDKENKLAGIIVLSHDITERKRADEKLKESEKKYRLLADNVDDVIFVLDMNMNYTFVSPSVKILLGYEPEELLKLQASETMTPSSWDLATKQLSYIIELEKSEYGDNSPYETLQLEMRKKNGSTVWTEVKASYVRDENKRPVGIIGVSRDITERRKADEELQESEKKYRLLAENIKDVVFVMDMNLNYTYLSPSVKLLRGYEPDEAMKHTPAETVTPSSMDLAISILSEMLEIEKSEHREINISRTAQLEMSRKDGTTVWVETKASFIRDENKRAVGIMGVTRNITERRKAEEAQQKSEEQFRLLAENARDTIWAMDMNLQYTYMSPYVKQTLDYTPEEYILMPLNEIMTPASLELCMQVFTEEIEIEKRGKRDPLWSRTIEIEHIHRSGKIVPVEIKLTFIRNAAGQATGFLGYTRDITERKLAAAKLQQTLDNLKKAVDTTIHVMVSVIEARDPYTAGHQLRVADLARAIATEMGLDQEEIDGIQLAGSIHDIGKLSVPAEILSKPTKLTKIEYSMIKEHPRSGYEILKDVESPWPLAQVAYQHHERMDGSGYPRNLKGDEILMEARIMAVADVVEAMSSHRPYRPSLGIDAALEEIEKNKGTLYDATVADACLKLFREKGYKLLT